MVSGPRRVAVAASNGLSSSALYLTGLDGRGTVVDHDFADQLTWSPDGRELAYTAIRELRVVDRTGTSMGSIQGMSWR
jgi:hypothetical protein